MITSADNKKIKQLIRLKQAKYRKSDRQYLVEGPHLVQEARLAGVLLEAFSIEEKEGYTQIEASLMRKICSTDTLVGEIGLCQMKFLPKTGDPVLILDGIQDPGNMGALMRSAAAFGFTNFWVGQGSVDLFNEKVIRASQGAIFKLSFAFGKTVDLIATLSDYQIFATDVTQGMPLSEVPPISKIAVILGNEGNGISEEVKALGLKNIYIPMRNTESLNVSVAGGIILYCLQVKNLS
ncbi:MAG TPA: RNA methyltransferase [Candidatus Pelethenecus faecipullorum]|uniref:RNA methyltransferase n=1 Tax=Candidatus Pelethenecus faecipullorum TaxID=2840900 RepID=A0A9D1GQG7_9MOLU|nr:RNA methyltransferase [Candidatus Pelethenecus faecipullorum]